MSHEEPDSIPLQNSHAADTRSIAAWLLLSAIGTCAIVILAAQIPPRFRLLGPFSVGLSLLTAALVYRSARAAGLPSLRILLLAGTVLIAAAPVGTTCLLHREEVRQLARHYQTQAVPIESLLPVPDDAGAEIDPQEQLNFARQADGMIREERNRLLSEQSAFDAYLQRRFAPLLGEQTRLPAAFIWPVWGVEILASAVAGLWLLKRLASHQSPQMDGSRNDG